MNATTGLSIKREVEVYAQVEEAPAASEKKKESDYWRYFILERKKHIWLRQ